MKWFLAIISFFLIGFQVGCSLLPVKNPQKEAEQVYKKDLKVEVDGQPYKGFGILPIKNSYKITIFPTGAVDRIILQTCNREVVVDKPSKDGWFKNSYTFSFAPLPGLETRNTCYLEIAVIEKKSIANGFAFFDFQDEREEVSLPASLQCNGEYLTPKGVGLCLGAANLKQRIWFQQRTILEGVDPECETIETTDGFFYNVILAPSECTYWFVARERAKNGKRKLFRLTTIGYTAIPFRED